MHGKLSVLALAWTLEGALAGSLALSVAACTRAPIVWDATGPADHGSEVLPVELTIDQCDVHLTPSTVIARW